MRVLVTGHNGYIGVVLTPLLQQAGHLVTGLDTDLFVRGEMGPPPPDVDERLCLDVRAIEVEHLSQFDAVIHLAGISNDPLGDLNPDCTYDINHRGTVDLARKAKAAGVGRFLFAASCSMYGAGSHTETLDEDAPFHPVTPYGEAKVWAERDLRSLADDNFSPTFLRCATAYGYSCRLRGDLVVNNLTAYAWLTGKVFLKSDGSAWRPLVHIEDIARAYRVLLEAPRERIHNEAFNVGRSSENYQIRDVANMVQRVVPACEVTFAEGATADKRCYIVDCSKLETHFPEYQPQWTVEKGIEELYSVYRRYAVTEQEVFGPQHIRLKQIQQLLCEGLIDDSLSPVAEQATDVAAITQDRNHV